MRGTIQTLHCDSEDGCGEWTPDWYGMTADNWRELIGDWEYDPYADRNRAFCPRHKGGSDDLP